MSMESKIIKINDIDLPVKEYNGQLVVTMNEVDMVHRRPEGTARKRFLDNKQRFIEGVDYFKVSASQKSEFRTLEIPNRGLILLTESGYLMLVKSFTDDLAWMVQRQLVNTYFRATPEERHEAAQQTMSDMEILSRAFLIATNEIKSLRETVDDQVKAIGGLNAKIEADAPAVAFAKDIGSSKSAITFDKFAKSLFDKYEIKIGRNRLFKFLREMKILKRDNIPYQKYMEYGWFRVRQTVKNDKLLYQTLILGAGQQKLYEIIKEHYQEGGVV